MITSIRSLIARCRKASPLRSSNKKNDKPVIIYYDSETSAIMGELEIIKQNKKNKKSERV